MTLGGNVCIRNGNLHDYSWREAIKSLLPVCDEVVVCDGESTDGTLEEIWAWMKIEPKIKLCTYQWPNPVGDIDFWVNWLNYAREHISCDWHIQLDADEVLAEWSYPVLRSLLTGWKSLWCQRYNFWKDHRSLIPPGVNLSHRVVRVAPTRVWMPSDGPHPKGGEAVSIAVESPVEIMHYGFLRKREAVFRNKAGLLRMFFNADEDPRMVEAQKSKGNWMAEIKGVEWTDRLLPYHGPHPKIMHEWLRERGYAI